MAGAHLGLEEHRPVSDRRCTQLRCPLGRLPILHPRIVQPGGDEERRVDTRFDVLVRGVGANPGVLVCDRGVPPFFPFHDGQRQRLVDHRVHHVDERHFGDGRAESSGIEVHRGTNSEPAGTTASHRHPLRIAVARIREVTGSVDHIGEGVHLVGELSTFVPRLAHLSPATHVGNGVDDSTIEEAETRN